MRSFRLLSISWLIMALNCLVMAEAPALGDEPVNLPPGFQMVQAADDSLATNIFCMIALPDGGALVSGPGYIRKLIDDDGDGVFDRAETIADFPNSGAQGLAVDGQDLLCVGDGGVWRLKRALAWQIQDTKPVERERLFAISTNGEHHAHSIQKGPDGWWYLMAGNDAKFDESLNWGGPIRQRRAGVLMRFSADFSQREYVAHGFRNAYDFAFSHSGQLFTFDSDAERDVSLPWYRPTRIFRLRQGDDAGWVNKSWKRPASYFDMPELIGEAGRGSPTGVVCYRGILFDSLYDDAVFVGDWTFGRVLVCYRQFTTKEYSPPVEFLTTNENFGFPVTDLAVAQDGSLLVSVGGRGTAGGVYRISQQLVARDLGAGFRDALSSYVPSPKRLPLESRPPRAAIERDTTIARLISLDGAESSTEPALKSLIRNAQLLLGGAGGTTGVFSGVTAVKPIELSASVADRVAMSLAELVRDAEDDVAMEAARLAVMLGLKSERLAVAYTSRITAESALPHDIHWLSCLAKNGYRSKSITKQVSGSLKDLGPKARRQSRPTDMHWQPMLTELATELLRVDAALAEQLLEIDFGGADHAFLFAAFPDSNESQLVNQVARWVISHPAEATVDHVQVLASGADKWRTLRLLDANTRVQDSVVIALANRANAKDRAWFVKGLQSANPTAIKQSAISLRKASKGITPQEAAFALAAALKLGNEPQDASVRDQLALLLRKFGGRKFGYQLKTPQQNQNDALMKWRAYLIERTPATDAILKETESHSRVLARFEKLDFQHGDPRRGQLVYETLQCGACHGASRGFGPRLDGVTKRLGRNDLLMAIVNPDAQVSDRYRATLFETVDGQFYSGTVVYENADGATIRDASGLTVRLNADQIESQRRSRKSVMPAGLLDNATDQQVIDLMAYLKTL